MCAGVYACMSTCVNCKISNSCLLDWVHMHMLEVHVCLDSHPNSLVQAFSYFNQSVVTMTMTVTMVFTYLYSLSGFFR